MNNKDFSSSPAGELESKGYVTSPQVSDKVDLNIGQYLLKLKRRWKPATAVFLITLGTAIFLSLLLKETYAATGRLLFKQNTAASLTGVGEESAQLSNLSIDQTPLNNEVEKLTAAPVLQETIEELKLTNDEGELLTPEDFARQLKVELVGGSDVIEVAYETDDPKDSAEVVNRLMEIYVRKQIRSNQSEPATAREFINRQLPEIETKVQSAESELEKFRTENKIVDLAEEQKAIVQDLGTINRDLADIGANYQGTKAQTAAIQNQLGLNLNQAISANQLGNTPLVQSTLSELATTEATLSQERQRFNNQHPNIVSLEEKKSSLRQALGKVIEREVGKGVRVSDGTLNPGVNNRQTLLENFINLKVEELSLQQQLGSIAQARQSYLKRANDLPRLDKKEQELVRKAESANKTYTALLDSLQQVQLAENQQTGNVEIIEMASPPEEGSSGRLPLIALGLLSGLFLSNLTAIILDWRDRTVKSVPEVKRKFPYKVLGIIPQLSSNDRDGVMVRNDPDSYVSELYRMLHANLKFISAQRAPKVILTTSSVPGEGKSTITANLAAAISQLGKKVLLIDGDLRKPSQSILWELTNVTGIKEVIDGSRPFANSVYQPMPKLDLLLAGNRISNPLAILDSPEMGKLIALCRKNYDLILIDSPPLPVRADVLTLSKLVDGILFVSRIGVLDQESADMAHETLDAIQSNILGMVINGVKSNELDKYSYASRYGNQYLNGKSANASSQNYSKR